MHNDDQEWADLLSPTRRGLLRGGGLAAAFAASGIAVAATPAGKSPYLAPRGPHVTPSFYFGFSNAQLHVIVPWLQLNSLGLTILIHPNTDDPRADHLYYTLWVNRSQAVNAYGMKKPGPGEPPVEQIYPNTKPSVKLET